MRILKSSSNPWVARVAAAILAFSVVGYGASTALAGPSLSQAAQNKVVDTGSAWTSALSTAGKKLPIIVEFAMPTIPSQPASATDADRDKAVKSAVRSTQEGILSRTLGLTGTKSISSAQSSGGVSLRLMSFVPQFAMVASAQDIEKLAADPTVVKIYEDKPVPPLLDDSVPLIGMPAAYAQGATGNGYRVAVLDTGGRRTHEFLSSRIDNEACFNFSYAPHGSTSRCPGGAASSTATGSGADCNSTPIYGCGHGTHVSGTAAGFNTNRQSGEPANGVARDGRILAINVFSQFPLSQCSVPQGQGYTGCVLSYTSDQIAALEYVNNNRTTLSIASVNMSLGGGAYSSACDSTEAQTAIINTLRANNVAVVIAAGNDSLNTEVGSPGCISGAITVASSTKADVRSSFSNWGSLIDVVAPGSSIYASYTNNGNIGYASLNGTSMATPHVAGAWAALRSAVPNATVSQIETALENTGLGITSSGVTKPRIRVDQALTALGGGNATRIVAAVTPVARSTQFGTNPSTGQPFYVTAFASVTNAGAANATGCTIAKPADGLPYTLIYAQRLPPNLTSLGPTNASFDLAPGDANAKHFLLVLTPSAAMSSNISIVFDCTNTAPAPTYIGVNSFQLTATAAPTPDVIATVGTPNDGGIIAIAPNGGRIVATAAMNIGQTATISARLSTTPIGGSTINLPLTLGLCQTNPSTGVCLQSPTTLPINFTATKDAVNTFTAFINHSGAAIPWDPGTNRVYIQFFNGSTPIGAASIAVYTSPSS